MPNLTFVLLLSEVSLNSVTPLLLTTNLPCPCDTPTQRYSTWVALVTGAVSVNPLPAPVVASPVLLEALWVGVPSVQVNLTALPRVMLVTLTWLDTLPALIW